MMADTAKENCWCLNIKFTVTRTPEKTMKFEESLVNSVVLEHHWKVFRKHKESTVEGKNLNE